MTDNDKDKSILDQIAQDIGEVTEEQDDGESSDSPAREGEGKPEEMDKRDMNDYDGGW